MLGEACVEMAQILWTTQKIILFHFESGLRKDSRGQAETVVPWVGDVHESANYRKVASLLVSCSTITSMRGMFRLNGRAGGFGPASGWNRFLPVEL